MLGSPFGQWVGAAGWLNLEGMKKQASMLKRGLVFGSASQLICAETDMVRGAGSKAQRVAQVGSQTVDITIVSAAGLAFWAGVEHGPLTCKKNQT